MESRSLDELWAHDVAELGEEELRQLAEWRGWDQEFCRFLRNESAIGLHRYQGKLCWAFPVYDETGQLVSIHFRLDPAALGGRASWRYEPAGKTVHPLLRGSLGPACKRCFLLESSWDALACEALLDSEIASSCIVATRGAGNAERCLGGLVLPPECQLFAIPQNDEAGSKWLKAILNHFGRLRVARISKEVKDLNDWQLRGHGALDLWKLIQLADFLEAPSRFEREKISDLPDKAPPMVIPGILYQGGKLLISAPSKARKTWLIHELTYCVANGLVWWGRYVPRGRVLLLNLELMRWEVRDRFEAIQESYGHGNFDNIDVITLRGKQFSHADFGRIAADCEGENFALAAIDPVYKSLSGLRENDPGDITKFLAAVENFGDQLNASTVLCHHFAKGDSAAREAIDRASGTGVWARDPDGLITLTPHEESSSHYTVDVNLRSFAQIAKFVIRFEHPRFYADTDADPEEIKRSQGGRPRKAGSGDIAALLTLEESLSFSEFKDRAMKILGISKSTFSRRLKEAIAQHRIFQSKQDDSYQLWPVSKQA